MADKNVKIVLSAQNKAEAALSQVNSQFKDISKGTENLRKGFTTVAAVGTAAFVGVATAIGFSLKAAAEAEQNQAQLNAVLASTGGVAGVTAAKVNELAASLSQVSTFTDDEIVSAQNLLLTFTNLKDNVFPEATQTVLDMSVALGQDLQSSSIQVGKALQDPILGVTALRRVGVNFNEAQQDVIKTLVETGRTLEAQKIILNELATEFGGSALAKAKTFGGVMKILTNNISELQEQIGNALLPAFKNVASSFNEVVLRAIKWVETHPAIVRAIVGTATAFTALIAIVGVLGVAFLTLSASAGILGVSVSALLGPIGLIIGGISLLSAVVGVAAYEYGGLKTSTDSAAESAKIFSDKMPDVRDGIVGISKDAKKAADDLKKLNKELGDIYKDFAKKESDSRRSVAELFVEQEEKVTDISKELADKRREYKKAQADKDNNDTLSRLDNEITGLEQSLEKEKAAIQRQKIFLGGLDKEYAEARRRAELTDFERRLEDIIRERVANLLATGQKILDKKAEIAALLEEEKKFTEGMIVESNTRIKQYQKEASARVALVSGSITSSIGSTANSTVSSLPRRATGGPVTGGSSYIVGENGPERFVPNNDGSIIPNRLLGGGGVTIYITGNQLLSQDAGEVISEMIMRKLKGNLRL